jgi:peroxiredoxin
MTTNMKKQILILAISMVFGLGSAYAQFPNVKVENAKGASISTSTLADLDKPVIVSFWSITCKPCMQEMNAMLDLMDDWREEADFEIVAVSIDDARSSSVAKSLATSNGWDRFTLLFDKNQELKRALNVNMAPHTFIFDKNGKIVYSHVGYTPGTEEEYIEKIKSLN